MIQIDFVNKTHPDYSKQEQAITEAIITSLERLNVIRDLIVEVLLVRQDTIKKLNRSYRKIDQPTDVLSFPQSSANTSETAVLGTIIISPVITRKKGEELTDVVKHGLLHLLGYDHEINESEWERVAKTINCSM